MIKARDIVEVAGNGLMYVLSASQTKEIFEIISLVLSILISILIVVSKVIAWFKEAKKDGKITADEIKDGVDIVMGGIDDIKEKVEGKEEKEDA